MTEPAQEAFLDALVEDDPVQLYEQAPCGFLSTTPEGVIVKANATLCRWLGTDREGLVRQRSFVDLLTPGGRIYHETHYAPLLQMHDKVRELALDLVRADGGRLPVLVNATLVRDEEGRPRLIRVAVFDASDRRRYERELRAEKDRAEASEARARTLARTLQQTLLPPTEPRIPGLELATAYRPAADGLLVGGDFYDVFQLGRDEWGVLLGDVCGKDAEAATVTALARWTLRAAAVESEGTAHALANLNELLRSHETELFCTAVLVRLRPHGASWRAVLSVGGHPPPLLLGGSGEVAAVTEAGPLIGVIEGAHYPETHLTIEPGRGLLLYTDGATDARRGSDFFDDHRLLASVRARGSEPRRLVDGLVGDIEEFQEGPASDDLALLALRVPPSPAHREQDVR
ncbi:SpoIIE family protein phosphatase [Nocardioides antri]|uniref:SpoIIE family protein phosphatase n=1 Tax=Nocardioides antri TaxID=2607659 RepID=A0A5B1M4F7_9ACTN|nr:SpoIIE family protein phosphatase [Nocardioides antri]KAA1427536.1 SpoIIE family protein phosphatase [Nocardioides antri]